MTREFYTATDVAAQRLPDCPVDSAREAFRHLCCLYGFEQARGLMAEIINAEAGGRYGR